MNDPWNTGDPRQDTWRGQVVPDPEPSGEEERPWEAEPEYTPGEKFAAMMGAVSAALMIGAVYAVGLLIVILLLLFCWK